MPFFHWDWQSHSHQQNEHSNERTTLRRCCIKSSPLLRITQKKLSFDLVILLRSNCLDRSKTFWSEVSVSPISMHKLYKQLYSFSTCYGVQSLLMVSHLHERTDGQQCFQHSCSVSLNCPVLLLPFSLILLFSPFFSHLPRGFKSWIRNGICCIKNC